MFKLFIWIFEFWNKFVTLNFNFFFKIRLKIQQIREFLSSKTQTVEVTRMIRISGRIISKRRSIRMLLRENHLLPKSQSTVNLGRSNLPLKTRRIQKKATILKLRQISSNNRFKSRQTTLGTIKANSLINRLLWAKAIQTVILIWATLKRFPNRHF